MILILTMLLSIAVSFADTDADNNTGADTNTEENGTVSTGAETAEKASSAVILFTGDLHSHLEQLPLIKTAYDAQKEKSDSVFLVDAGDFSMGTPFQTIYTSHAAELRTMGAVGWDVTTLGIGEFGFGTSGLTGMLNKAAKDDKVVLPEIVVSNIVWSAPSDDPSTAETVTRFREALEACEAKEYTVITRGGVSIAFFGVLSGGPSSDTEIGAPVFGDPVTAAGRIVTLIKEKEDVDLIVGLVQSGAGDKGESISEARNIAGKVQGIDYLICGGSERLEEPETVNGTGIFSAGRFGEYLGYAEISLGGEAGPEIPVYGLIPVTEKPEEEAEAETEEEDTGEDEAAEDAEGTGDAVDSRAAFIPEGFDPEGLEADQEIRDKVVGFMAAVNKDFFSYYGFNWDKTLADNVIRFTSADDLGDDFGEDPLGNLIADSLIYAVREAEGAEHVPVDVSIVSADTVQNTVGLGAITCGDAFNTVPLGFGRDGKSGYPLVSFWLTGEELKLLAEADVTTLRNKSIPSLYFAGLEYKWNPHRVIYDRAYEFRIRNEEGEIAEIDDNSLYRVVTDLYSSGLLAPIGPATKGLLKITPRDEKGQPVENMGDRIINTAYGDELKEWYALASYIDSFENDEVPDYYRVLQGRKQLVDSWSPIAILRNPNKFFFVVTALFVLVIMLIYVAVRLIAKAVIRRRKLAAEAPKELPEGAEAPEGVPAESAETTASAAETPETEGEGLSTEAPAVYEETAEGEDSQPEERPEEIPEETVPGEAAEEAPGEAEPEGPAKPLWSEIFTPVAFNWDTDRPEGEDGAPLSEVPEWSGEYGVTDKEDAAEEIPGPMTPFGPAPGRAPDEPESEFSSVKSLFADMGDLGADVIGAVSPNVEPEEPVFEHFDFDWSQEVPETEDAYEVAPEDRIKEGEKVFGRAVRINDEEEMAALRSAEELLNQKVSRLRENKKSRKKDKIKKQKEQTAPEGGDKAKKYHISDKRKRRK